MSYDVSASRTVAVPVERAFDLVLPIPLVEVFASRFGPIPPIREVREQIGEWGTVGQTRTILLADGGRMREELTGVRRPERFEYTISEISGPMRPLVARVEGAWDFAAADGGTRITWSWRLHPTNALTGLLMPVFAMFWRGYANRALARLDQLIGS